jgi:hypothetical protein
LVTPDAQIKSLKQRSKARNQCPGATPTTSSLETFENLYGPSLLDGLCPTPATGRAPQLAHASNAFITRRNTIGVPNYRYFKNEAPLLSSDVEEHLKVLQEMFRLTEAECGNLQSVGRVVEQDFCRGLEAEGDDDSGDEPQVLYMDDSPCMDAVRLQSSTTTTGSRPFEFTQTPAPNLDVIGTTLF